MYKSVLINVVLCCIVSKVWPLPAQQCALLTLLWCIVTSSSQHTSQHTSNVTYLEIKDLISALCLLLECSLLAVNSFFKNSHWWMWTQLSGGTTLVPLSLILKCYTCGLHQFYSCDLDQFYWLSTSWIMHRKCNALFQCIFCFLSTQTLYICLWLLVMCRSVTKVFILHFKVLRTLSSIWLGFKQMSSRSWQYISCPWDARPNHSALRDRLKALYYHIIFKVSGDFKRTGS